MNDGTLQLDAFKSNEPSTALNHFSAKLIENVQFIYELALAELELESFGAKYLTSNSWREFILQNSPNLNRLVRRLAYFKQIGDRETDYYRLMKYNQTRSVNQYLTHWIYPYKGKFHPQMIRSLLNILKLGESETVLDPFIGSGTLAVESQLLGINCIGIDASPLCVLQSKVKTESAFAIERIKNLREEAVEAFTSSKGSLSRDTHGKTYDDFLSSIDDDKTRNFFTMAKLVAISDEARRNRQIIKSYIKNLDKMVASVQDYQNAVNELKLNLGNVQIHQGNARDLPFNPESVQGIITSPPYSIALDYVSNDAHALSAMGVNLEELRNELVGVRGKGQQKIRLYNEDITESYEQMHRVLEKGRYCAIVIGNATYQGDKIKTIEFTIKQCENLGFKLHKNLYKKIFGLYNVMQTDNTLIFKKEK